MYACRFFLKFCTLLFQTIFLQIASPNLFCLFSKLSLPANFLRPVTLAERHLIWQTVVLEDFLLQTCIWMLRTTILQIVATFRPTSCTGLFSWKFCKLSFLTPCFWKLSFHTIFWGLLFRSTFCNWWFHRECILWTGCTSRRQGGEGERSAESAGEHLGK